MNRHLSLLALAVALLPTAAFADTIDAGTGSAADAAGASQQQDPHDDDHDAVEASDIVVTGARRNLEDVLGGVSVVDGSELAADMRPSIGETLAKQPGVSATSFGPAASRPILRGLGGDRIRILTDGIGSLDMSSSSADHAVAINPLTAERVEILRGPSALLFGSGAIGGVVNVVDSRIPRRDPERPLHAEGMVTYGTAADERSANLAVDVPLGSGFVLHGDGSWSNSDDLETGGHILSNELREIAAASPELEIRELADLEGELPNSASRSAELAGGLAYVKDDLNVGFSVTRHTQKYGVPIRYSLDPAIEAEAPTIDAEQTRYDVRAEVPVGGLLEVVRLRGGYSKYHHDELEETGEVGSSFFAKGGELRADAVQDVRSGWGGTSGLQYVEKKVRIEGEEKYLPDARQKQFGLFTLQHLERGQLRLEAGARFETSKLTADADEQLGTPEDSRSFNTFSGSLGALYEFSPGWRAGLNLSRSARAPAIDELYANGPHAGTQAFEVGDPDLDSETSLGVEASFRKSRGPVRIGLSAFYSRFANFIYQAPTGEIEDDLPVFEYRQGKARYYGFEAELSAPIGTVGGVEWGVETQADWVHATIEDVGPAPQIPPLRLLGAITGAAGKVDGRLEVEHAFRQSRNADLETETAGYTLLNASVEWHPIDEKPELTLGLSANNLFDVVARRHSSLLKDYAPLAGRDIRVNARFQF